MINLIKYKRKLKDSLKRLSFLIENPDEISIIEKRARLFIEKEHDYIKIAEKYLETWRIN